MTMSSFRDSVSQRVLDALRDRPAYLDAAGADLLDDFVAPALALCAHGKRTRALIMAAGFQAIDPDAALPVHAGAALELYQASALVHDDIIDDADTRRGLPATHHGFADQHVNRGLMNSATDFGAKAALLLGDYLLSLAVAEFEAAEAVDRAAHASARRIFADMTAETAFGQFLDMRAEFTELTSDVDAAISSALLVLRHKSARYSIEVPLMIGGALAGADTQQIDALSRIGRPLGEAFQLRDDELGIFGDPQTTGKPAGGDITEGKRTVLLALTRSMASATDTAFIDDVVGTQLSDSDVARIRDIMVTSGAHARHEAMIAEREDEARRRQSFRAPLLDELMDSLVGRRQ